MSGAMIIGELLRDDAGFTGLVPAKNIRIERLADDADLNAVVLREISSIESQTLKQRSIVRTTDRVSVTVRARSLRERDAILRAARAVCAGRLGSIAGCARVSVLTVGKGPGLAGPGNSFERAQDFRVSFDAPL